MLYHQRHIGITNHCVNLVIGGVPRLSASSVLPSSLSLETVISFSIPFCSCLVLLTHAVPEFLNAIRFVSLPLRWKILVRDERAFPTIAQFGSQVV